MKLKQLKNVRVQVMLSPNDQVVWLPLSDLIRAVLRDENALEAWEDSSIKAHVTAVAKMREDDED